jgi:hypothetical protein
MRAAGYFSRENRMFNDRKRKIKLKMVNEIEEQPYSNMPFISMLCKGMSRSICVAS